MGLDIRWPIGLMFTFIGVLLIGFGAVNSTDSQRLGMNINLVWGIVLLVFGVLMLLGASRGKKMPPPA
jgi:formate hydrogenlyase subunit 3/multisubunit Na+/H+ antiporter MnhD subunit